MPRNEWRQAAQDREAMYAKRHILKGEQLSRGSKSLPALRPGDCVAIQNQTGNQSRQWQRTGVVIEAGPHNSYTISVDGSRTITKRNRQYLRKISPFIHSTIPSQPQKSKGTSESDPKPAEHEVLPSQENIPHPVPASPSFIPPASEETSDTVNNAEEDDPPIPKILLKKKTLPTHLRERWVVASPQPQSTQQQDVQGSVTPLHYTSYPTFPIMSHDQPSMIAYNQWMSNQYNMMMMNPWNQYLMNPWNQFRNN